MKFHITQQKNMMIKDIVFTSLYLIGATSISTVLLSLNGRTTNVGIIYMMAVFLTARHTSGYIPGVIASFISVICVNYVFTYPYMELDFTLEGYPVTFVVLLGISTLTSTGTTHMKNQSIIINEREKLLMEAEKETMRANLLRAISHDLRTPLTGIIGAGNAYLENTGTMTEAEKSSLVSNICEDANWLLNMVENLLSVTRIKGDKAAVSKSPEALEEVVSEAVQRFHKRFPNAVVHVSVPEEFLMVPMDATLIEQVIINLLENSVHHSNSTEPVSLSVTVFDGFARFKVRDQGIGIPPERLSNLFDGYTVSPNNSFDSQKGMGIGLSICKTIIAAHGGCISASNEKQGAVFTFTLPLGEEPYE